jgi:tellurite resistance protein
MARRLRVPPNLFGMTFGTAGVAATWHAAAPAFGAAKWVSAVLYLLAAVLWLALVVAYLLQGPRQWADDLRHPLLAPFVAVPVVVGMLLGAALSEWAFDAGRVLVIVFVIATILLGGWLTGQWIVADLAPGTMHPGYFLPTVAGGLIGGLTSAEVGLPALGWLSFGIGVVCWLVLGSVVTNRLFFTPALAPPLVPTLAIELAPPAVAGLAWFALTHTTGDPVAYGLAGYVVLMALVQLRFLPLFRRLTFQPGFWAFTFSYAAAATDAVIWLDVRRPAGWVAYTIVVLVLITGFVAVIAARTALLATRGQLFPAPEPAH